LCARNQFAVLHFVAAFLPLVFWYKMPLHHNNFFEHRNGESDPSAPPFVAPLIEKGDVRIRKLVDSKKWSCRTQGKYSLSFQEAVECEKKCRQKLLASVPNYYFKAVIEFLDGTKYCISTIMDELRFQFKHMFFEGQPVICRGQIVSSRLASNRAKSSKITNGEKANVSPAKIEEEVIKEAKQMIYTIVMRQGNKVQKIENVKPDQIKSLGVKPPCGKVIREIVRTFASKPNFASSSFPWKADRTVLNELKSFDIEVGDLPEHHSRSNTSQSEKKKKEQPTSKSSRSSTNLLQYFPRVDKTVGDSAAQSATTSPQKRKNTPKKLANSQKNTQVEKILKKAKTVRATPKTFSFNIEKLETMWIDTLEKPNNWRVYCHYADAIVRKRGTVKEFEVIPNEALRRDMLSRLQLRKLREKIDGMTGEDKKQYVEEYKLKRKELQLEQNKLCDDLQVTNSRALPMPSLCMPPEPMSHEDYGEMLSLFAFIHCYRSAFDSFNQYQLNFTDLCKAIASCCDSDNFQEANGLLVCLLEAAMQAEIVENYEEFGIPLKSVTLDIYSASEIARIMLKENDYYESEDEERKSSVSDNSDQCIDLTMQSLMEEMANVEFCQLDVKWKTKVLWYLMEMLLRSNVVEEFLRKSYQKFHSAWKRKMQLTNELMKLSENNNTDKAVNNGKLDNFLVDLEDEEDEEKKKKKKKMEMGESSPSKVHTMPKQTLTLRQQVLQEEKVKREKQKEEREREAARERLRFQLETVDKSVEMMRKFSMRSLNKIAPLGTDRYYNRYWFFGKWLPGLFVEKGCFQSSTFASGTKNEEHCSNVAVYQWYHYSTEEQIRELIERLLDKGERESRLKKAISKCLPEIVASLNSNSNGKSANVFVESEFENPVKCMKKRLLDLEQQFTAGHFVQFQDRNAWLSQVKKAADLKRLADLLVSLQKMIRPNLLCGWMQMDVAVNSKKKSRPSADEQRIAKWQRAVHQAATFSRLFVLLSVFENSVQLYRSTTKAKCQTCRKSDDLKCLLLCDACNAACHTYCSRPPLQAVPSVAWLCISCKRYNSKEKIKRERQENDEICEGKTSNRCTRGGKMNSAQNYVERLNGRMAYSEVQKKCSEIFEKIQSSGLSSYLQTMTENAGVVLRSTRAMEKSKTLAFVKSRLNNYASLEEFFSDLKTVLQNGRTACQGRKRILRNLDDLEEMIEALENEYETNSGRKNGPGEFEWSVRVRSAERRPLPKSCTSSINPIHPRHTSKMPLQQQQHHHQAVILNIGGRRFSVSVHSLAMEPESILTQLVREQWRPSLGFTEVYIHRDPTYFHYVLNYLRNGHRALLPSNEVDMAQLFREAEFYQLHGLLPLLWRITQSMPVIGDQLQVNDEVSWNPGVLSLYWQSVAVNNRCYGPRQAHFQIVGPIRGKYQLRCSAWWCYDISCPACSQFDFAPMPESVELLLIEQSVKQEMTQARGVLKQFAADGMCALVEWNQGSYRFHLPVSALLRYRR
ncbi:Tyrosine-protein kinase BAZ1B, partial [Trichinella pseudospiralis]